MVKQRGVTLLEGLLSLTIIGGIAGFTMYQAGVAVEEVAQYQELHQPIDIDKVREAIYLNVPVTDCE